MDASKPNVARVYDYLLGGKDHYAIDRELANQLLEAIPEARKIARLNREFLVDAVRTMARAGIRQFLDLGAGIPTSPNVHEIAREVHPEARVVYLDRDPVVLAHNRALLSRAPGIVAVQADLRDPAGVLADRTVRATLDFDEPIGLLMVAVLHFVDQVTAPRIAARYVRELAEGSYVAMSVGCADGVDESVAGSVRARFSGSDAPVTGHSEAEISGLFEGLDLGSDIWLGGRGGLIDLFRSTTARLIAGVGRKGGSNPH